MLVHICDVFFAIPRLVFLNSFFRHNGGGEGDVAPFWPNGGREDKISVKIGSGGYFEGPAGEKIYRWDYFINTTVGALELLFFFMH